METIIQPRVLKGFRDFLPNQEIARSSLIEKITNVFRASGFVPIDTPVLEYSEILLRKSEGETEKQVFRFNDNGGRDVALRFDLTVPFARFTAMHKSELYFPFKRYHIAKVWRGEKPQAGRYREFVQCDFDIIGNDSAAGDFEILRVIKDAFAAIGINNIKIHVNHRGVFNRFLAKLRLQEKSEDILRAVDKLAKVGSDEVARELAEIAGSDETAEKILSYINGVGGFEETLSRIEEMAGGVADDTKRIKEVYAMLCATGISESYVLNPSITRGLDYYTGIVCETFLDGAVAIGSVCSGGRYDDLAGLYMKEKVPGVGASIGLDRLIAALESLGFAQDKGSYIDAEIFCLDEKNMTLYQKAAAALRVCGVAVEVFPEAKKEKQQYALCDAKKIPWGIFIKDENVADSTLSLKNLLTRETSRQIRPEEAAEIIKNARQNSK